MLTTTTLTLASIEQAITRNRSMRESCVRFEAPQAALDTLDARFVELEAERRALMRQLPQANYEMVEAKQAAYHRLIEAMV